MTDTSGVDIFADSEDVTATPQDLASVTALAQQVANLEKEIEDDQAAVAVKQSRLDQLQQTDLPDLMQSLNLKQFVLFDGSKIEIKDVVRASIPVARRPEAYEWLTEKGHESLIKKEVQVPIGRDASIIVISKLVETAKELGYEAIVSEKVEPPTLTAFVKDQLAQGASIPMDLFGVYQGRKATIKQPKKGK